MFLSEKAESAFNHFADEAYGEGVLDSRTKELLALAASIMADCTPCIRHHGGAALAAGATADEILEVSAIVMAILAGSKRAKYRDVLDEVLSQSK